MTMVFLITTVYNTLIFFVTLRSKSFFKGTRLWGFCLDFPPRLYSSMSMFLGIFLCFFYHKYYYRGGKFPVSIFSRDQGRGCEMRQKVDPTPHVSIVSLVSTFSIFLPYANGRLTNDIKAVKTVAT